MTDVTDLTHRIVDGSAGAISCHGEVISLSALAALYTAIEANGSTALHRSVCDVLLRLTETHVLSHPKLNRLVDLWDAVVGTVRERIQTHLQEILGTEPHALLVEHVFRCLSGSAARRGRGSREHQYQFEALLERMAADPAGTGELRCACCGYHFRVIDIHREKIRTILDAGLSLAKSYFPGRNEDPYKPILTRNNMSMTTLTIDHVIPEETLGWSNSDNLALLCALCNQGKLAYYRPLEALSMFAIGGLSNSPPGRAWNSLKNQIVVAAIRSQDGVCRVCGATRLSAELTVRPLTQFADGSLCGFAPWNLATVCYECAEPADVL